ncbi:MAG TPA: SpoIIE family protein phosphatase [Mobilitalea sp.]|nr:SpoIIE family protein phosphatase [Mobilitalea sp.]
MNHLCTDVGYLSVNKYNEQLCGDHIELVHQDEDTFVLVLADGLGSGVKANILSTLTAKIISTMMANHMSIENCVNTLASTLPVSLEHGIAYSTFSIIQVIDSKVAEVIQYDNPQVILLRNGINYNYSNIILQINDKTIYKSSIELLPGDILIAMSDGAVYAGPGKAMNQEWKRQNIIEYLEANYNDNYSAKMISTQLLDKCMALYGSQPGDDTTIAAIKIRQRQAINLLIGPPSNPNDINKMLALFFAKEGKHIICGGTTSSLVAKYLGKEIETDMDYLDPDIPPISKIEGIDLVTEGVITINQVLLYAKNYLENNDFDMEWSLQEDAASLVSRLLLEEATDINFYVGKAMNPAHQNSDLQLHFSIKMRLIEELSECLKGIGKRVSISYF